MMKNKLEKNGVKKNNKKRQIPIYGPSMNLSHSFGDLLEKNFFALV